MILAISSYTENNTNVGLVKNIERNCFYNIRQQNDSISFTSINPLKSSRNFVKADGSMIFGKLTRISEELGESIGKIFRKLKGKDELPFVDKPIIAAAVWDVNSKTRVVKNTEYIINNNTNLTNATKAEYAEALKNAKIQKDGTLDSTTIDKLFSVNHKVENAYQAKDVVKPAESSKHKPSFEGAEKEADDIYSEDLHYGGLTDHNALLNNPDLPNNFKRLIQKHHASLAEGNIESIARGNERTEAKLALQKAEQAHENVLNDRIERESMGSMDLTESNIYKLEDDGTSFSRDIDTDGAQMSEPFTDFTSSEPYYVDDSISYDLDKLEHEQNIDLFPDFNGY